MSRISILVILAACGDTGAPFSPEAVPSGTYTLTTTSTSDTCDPPRFTGTTTVAVFNKGSTLQLARSNSLGFAAYVLDAASGYALRNPPEGRTLLACADQPASSVVTSFVLTAADATHVEVALDEDWHLEQPCGPTTPTASCHVTQTLRYDLVRPE